MSVQMLFVVLDYIILTTLHLYIPNELPDYHCVDLGLERVCVHVACF